MLRALVIGGTRGIGRAITLELLTRDYKVIAVYNKHEKEASDLISVIPTNKSNNLQLCKMDIGGKDSISNLYEYVKEKFQENKIDVLILNTGKTNRQSFEELKLEEWEDILTFNCTIPLFIIQKMMPIMEKGSCIIATGSLMGIFPHSVSISYGVSKAALHSIVRNLVKVLSKYSIRINAIVPGFVETEWHKNKSTEMLNSIKRKISLNRFAETEEIASTFIHVIENKYINGQEIIVDGGYDFY